MASRRSRPLPASDFGSSARRLRAAPDGLKAPVDELDSERGVAQLPVPTPEFGAPAQELPFLEYSFGSDQLLSVTYITSEMERRLGGGIALRSTACGLRDVIHTDDRERVFDEHARAAAAGIPIACHYRLRRSPGLLRRDHG